jgi:DnaK suppressor protein
MSNAHATSFIPLFQEPYMSPRQLDYFHDKLMSLRAELTESNRRNLHSIDDSDAPPIEEVERSVQAMDREIALKTQVRNWELIRMIDAALTRIENGTYGYCEETEEPIGFGRLDANPVAVYCLSVQEEIEQSSNTSGSKIY